jgi:anti-sigma factor RsiW
MTSAWDNGHPPGQLLSALLDGELDGGEKAAVNGHLSGCAACAGELADLDRVRSVVRQLAFPTLAAGWEDDLIASVRAVDDEATVKALPSIVRVPEPAGVGGEATDPAYQGAVVALRRRVAVTAAAVAALAAAAVLSLFATESATAPQVGRMVQSHATSSGGGDPSRLAPVAVQASFGNN